MAANDTGTVVPAAWYPDPQGSPLVRWWDGTIWTAHTREPTPVAANGRAAAEVARPADDIVRLPPGGDAPQLPAYIPMQNFGSGSEFGRPDDRTHLTRPRVAGTPYNAWVWLLAAMPLLQIVVAVVVLVALKDLPGGVVRYALLIGPLAAHLYLAKRDGESLRANNLKSTPWGWILLPLAYFVIRMVRVGKEGLWPLLVWIATQVVLVLVALSVVLPVFIAWQSSGNLTGSSDALGADRTPVTEQPVPLTPEQRTEMLTPAGMGAKLLSDFNAGGVENMTYANCAPALSFAVGTEVQCATDLGGSPVTIVVTIQDDPYVPFYVTGTAP